MDGFLRNRKPNKAEVAMAKLTVDRATTKGLIRATKRQVMRGEMLPHELLSMCEWVDPNERDDFILAVDEFYAKCEQGTPDMRLVSLAVDKILAKVGQEPVEPSEEEEEEYTEAQLMAMAPEESEEEPQEDAEEEEAEEESEEERPCNKRGSQDLGEEPPAQRPRLQEEDVGEVWQDDDGRSHVRMENDVQITKCAEAPVAQEAVVEAELLNTFLTVPQISVRFVRSHSL